MAGLGHLRTTAWELFNVLSLSASAWPPADIAPQYPSVLQALVVENRRGPSPRDGPPSLGKTLNFRPTYSLMAVDRTFTAPKLLISSLN